MGVGVATPVCLLTLNVFRMLTFPGDFAVLLKSGMSVRQAVLYNALSAMMAYLGLVTGILIGHYAENVSMWIFALTAGLFMYVALVDMVSTNLRRRSDHAPPPQDACSCPSDARDAAQRRRRPRLQPLRLLPAAEHRHPAGIRHHAAHRHL